MAVRVKPSRNIAGTYGAAGRRAADAAGGKWNDRYQRSKNRAGNRSIAFDGVPVGYAIEGIGRKGKRTRGHGIFSRASAGHFDRGHAATEIARQFIWEADLSLFQDGFDQSRGPGAGTRRRGGGRGGAGGRANGRAGPGRAHVAFRACHGNLRDASAAAAAGTGASSAAHHDGGVVGARCSTRGDRLKCRFEMAERFA